MRRIALVLALFLGAISLPASAAVTGISAKAVRVPVKVISTSNLTLSGAQTIDSVAVVVGDLVGAVGQSDNKNAVYVVQVGAWKVGNPGFGTGLELYALQGSSNANKVYGADTTGAIVWGTTSVAFTLKSSSGTAFNPAIPGAIGGTNPAAGTFTTVVANTSVSSPDHIISALIGAPTATASATTLWRSSNLPSDNLILRGGTGDSLTLGFESGSGTSDIRKRFIVKSLVDDGTYDITPNGGGHGTITAPGASGSVSCSFSFAANGATTFNGVTFTTCDVADTDAKLDAFANSGALRIKNRLGSTQTVLIELTEALAP